MLVWIINTVCKLSLEPKEKLFQSVSKFADKKTYHIQSTSSARPHVIINSIDEYTDISRRTMQNIIS